MNKFEEVKKLAKNINIFRDIIKKAPAQYKQSFNAVDMDEHRMNRQQFEAILDFISHQSQIVPPTNQQKYQLFCSFNEIVDGFVCKEQYEKFTEVIFFMLAATQNA